MILHVTVRREIGGGQAAAKAFQLYFNILPRYYSYVYQYIVVAAGQGLLLLAYARRRALCAGLGIGQPRGAFAMACKHPEGCGQGGEEWPPFGPSNHVIRSAGAHCSSSDKKFILDENHEVNPRVLWPEPKGQAACRNS